MEREETRRGGRKGEAKMVKRRKGQRRKREGEGTRAKRIRKNCSKGNSLKRERGGGDEIKKKTQKGRNIYSLKINYKETKPPKFCFEKVQNKSFSLTEGVLKDKSKKKKRGGGITI